MSKNDKISKSESHKTSTTPIDLSLSIRSEKGKVPQGKSNKEDLNLPKSCHLKAPQGDTQPKSRDRTNIAGKDNPNEPKKDEKKDPKNKDNKKEKESNKIDDNKKKDINIIKPGEPKDKIIQKESDKNPEEETPKEKPIISNEEKITKEINKNPKEEEIKKDKIETPKENIPAEMALIDADNFLKIVKDSFKELKKGKNEYKQRVIELINNIYLKKIITNKLDDEEYLKKIREILKDDSFELKKGNLFFYNKNNEECIKNPFEARDGGSSKVAYDIYNEVKETKKICIQIFADQTYFACGMLQLWNTQEEATLRDVSPEMLLWLLATNKIKKIPHGKEKFRFEYVKDLSTSDGYIIKGKLCMANMEPLEKPIEIYFLFTSMPSLTSSSSSFDVFGGASWIGKFRLFQKLLGINPDKHKESERIFKMSFKLDNAKNLVRKFYESIEHPIDKKQFNREILILLFGDYSLEVNNEDSLEKIIEDIKEKAEPEDENNDYKKAIENYRKLISEQIGSWIKLARSLGIDYFIGGAIGCGAFGNDANIVSEIIAEQFKKYGGNMKYIYPQFGDRDVFKDIFEKAFAKEFK